MNEAMELTFDPIEEHRGLYVVEYQPPFRNFAVARLLLTFLETTEPQRIVELAKLELQHWLNRYPVPLMVYALDDKENNIMTADAPLERCLVGWIAPGTNEAMHSWDSKDLDAFTQPPHPDWRNIYKGVPFRTRADIAAKARESNRKTKQYVRFFESIFFFWLIVVPVGIWLFKYYAAWWVVWALTAYSFWKAARAWLKMTGRIKPSRSEAEKAEKKRKMEHHHYHCELNPEGFLRLKVENFDRETQERMRKEAEHLAWQDRP